MVPAVVEGLAGVVTCATESLPHALRTAAMTAPAIAGAPSRRISCSIVCSVSVLCGHPCHFDAPVPSGVPVVASRHVPEPGCDLVGLIENPVFKLEPAPIAESDGPAAEAPVTPVRPAAGQNSMITVFSQS